MWKGPGQDPGGPAGVGPPQDPSSSQELNDLKDQYEQQQLLIAQLKEMLRKTEQTNVSQEKVEEYANTLTKMNARAKRRAAKKESGGDVGAVSGTKKPETPASEKINMLRQQLEQNKVKLAERGKNQKGIEEIVTQLKAQLDDSQNLMNQTPSNLSLMDTTMEAYSVNSNSQELYNILLNKEKRITEMVVKIQKLEANVLDLQENVKEKDSVIDARTKAITLMSENLSKKGKSTLDALDDTKLQMRKMQENFIELESQMKAEKQKLVEELDEKSLQVNGLEHANDFLHKARQELLEVNSDLQEKLDSQTELLEKYKMELKSDVSNVSASNMTSNMNSELLRLTDRIKELEGELQKSNHCSLPSISSVDETDFQDLRKVIEDQNNENVKLLNRIRELEKEVSESNMRNDEYVNKLADLQNVIKDLNEKVLENPRIAAQPLNLDIKLESEEVVKLKKQLDESNKNMIKVKAQHKSKIKELNKKIDSFKKIGDVNVEVVKLQDENSKLNHKVVELEEEKGALQLKIMESDSTKDSINVERANVLEKKLSEQTELLSTKENSITLLEKQIEDFTLRIETLNEKLDSLSHLENAQVKSEITSIHFEEQLDKLESEKRALVKEKEESVKENGALLEKIENLTKEKQEVVAKLDSYIQENIELMDKLEKLSAEKVSSAESIEIVEGLTQQEKLELEAYQKNINISTGIKSSTEHLEENSELNESVIQLTEETTELLQRIELFTIERREVMEKMENLTQENNHLSLKIKEIENNRDVLAETYEQLQNEKEKLDTDLENLKQEKSELEGKVNNLESENDKLKQEIGEFVETKKNSAEEATFKSEIISDLHSSTQIANENLLKEIEEYKALIDIQRQEINELRVQLMRIDAVTSEKLSLEEKITSLQSEYEALLTENEDIKQQLKRNSEKVHEKDDIEIELNNTRKRITEFEEKVSSNLNEIENYRSIIEENKTELVASANIINDLQSDIQKKSEELVEYRNEVAQLNSNISDLNSAISQLEQENSEKAQNNGSIEIMSLQLQELKQILNENIQQIQEYERELEMNSEVINKLQKEIKALSNKILETEHLLESKDDEIKSLRKKKDENTSTISGLQDQIAHLKEDFAKVRDDMKEKCLRLKTQIDTNAGTIEDIRTPLEAKITELENKNREQLEKMKKYAAGLKKKTAAYQELEQKYSEINEKWEIEQKEKETLKIEANKNNALESKVQSLLEQLSDLENELTNVQNKLEVKVTDYNKLHDEFTKFKQESSPHEEFLVLESRNFALQQHNSQYNLHCEDLQNSLRECESKCESLLRENELLRSSANNISNTEIIRKDETITRLTAEIESLRYDSDTSSNALQMKIKELEMFIETQDSDLSKYKERVNKLEEGLSHVEERRQSLERKAIELGAQLEEKSTNYEEISHTEDLLEQRLSALIAHDEVIESRLQETISDNQELTERNKLLVTEVRSLQSKVHAAQEKVAELSERNESLSMFEAESSHLKQVIANLENEKRHLRSEYDNTLNRTKIDAEKSEVELQNQLESFNNERKSLIEQCEKLNERLKEYAQIQDLLNNEMVEYKQKLEEQDNALAVQAAANEKLIEDNQRGLCTIESLKAQLQMFENANKEVDHLNKLLEQKTCEIEECQRRNLQLQMQGNFARLGPPCKTLDLPLATNQVQGNTNQKEENFSTFGSDSNSQAQQLQGQIKALESQKTEAALKLAETQRYLKQALHQLDVLKQEKNQHFEDVYLKGSDIDFFNMIDTGQLKEGEDKLKICEREVGNLQADNSNFKSRNAELLSENATLQSDLSKLKQKINTMVSSSVEEAGETAVNTELSLEADISDATQVEDVNLFTWPQTESDPFAFIGESHNQSVDLSDSDELAKAQQTATTHRNDVIENNSREELLRKIKTLEFMLYSVEKEKDDALLQCHELTSELTRLVYDRENERQTKVESGQDFTTREQPQTSGKAAPEDLKLELEIISEGDTYLTQKDCEELQNIEFQRTKSIPTDSTDHSKPVVEDTMEAESAYLCYTDSKDRPPHKAVVSASTSKDVGLNLDSQVMSPDDTAMTETDRAQLQDVEFEKCKPVKKSDGTDYTKPVAEDKMRKKSAYLCYDRSQNSAVDTDAPNPSTSLDTFGENDDGWAWGPEEAKLEQEHQELVESSTSHSTQFKAQINELEGKIRVLESARERHLEEIKQSQLKSGKLIKKLKEFKTKNEQLSSQLNKKSDGFDDLNDAIHDELKSQIQRLEKRAREVVAELEKEKQEKGNLLKRVDVLTSANERMVENKEKQDVEILSWQQRSRELNAKLERFEWGDGGFESPKHAKEGKGEEANVDVRGLQVQMQELTDTVKDLTLDNEELQALLEEQRNLRVAAEKAKSVEPILENMKTEAEYLSLLTEKDALKSQLALAEEEGRKLQYEIDNYVVGKNITDQQFSDVTEENLQLNDVIVKNNRVIEDLSGELETLRKEHDALVQNQNIFAQNNLLLEELKQDNNALTDQVEKLRMENHQVQTNLEVSSQEKLQILKQLAEKDKELDELRQTIVELNIKLTYAQQQSDNNILSSGEIENLKQNLGEKAKEIDELKQNLGEKSDRLLALEDETNRQQASFEFKLSQSLKQLTEEWTQRVDQRGLDVAESWKLHLETRENEFMQVEQQLKKEINELEEKYNGLVNENNELRKNVDAEIRNEVDRVSALQQQINDRQNYINELTRLMHENQLESEKQQQEIAQLGEKTLSLTLQVEERDAKVSNLDLLRSQVSEKESVIDDLVRKLEASQSDNKKLTELEEEVEKYKTDVADLKQQITEKEEMLVQNSHVIKNYSVELESFKQSLSTLQQELKVKDDHIEDITKKLRDHESQRDYEANNLSVLQQQIYDYQHHLANTNGELQQSYAQIETLNKEVLKCNEFEDQLLLKEAEIYRLKSLLQEKEREIAVALENRSQESVVALNEQAQELDSLKRLFAQNEMHYEEVLTAKEVDNQSLRLQLDDQVNRNEVLSKEKEEFVGLHDELSLKHAECDDLQSKLREQNILLDEENTQLVELREIIQGQVLKIEDLQRQLYDKSRDYDVLIAEIDIPQKSRTDLQPTQEKRVTFADEPQNKTVQLPPEDDLSEPVSRAELDLALYMLHQRDVRCEELTVELMQLLEERDTLQLRLSNALREKEQLKSKQETKKEEGDESEGSSRKGSPKTGAVHKGKASAIVLGATGTELAIEATEQLKQQGSDHLTTKLSELKTVGYRKDKTLVDEQALRRFQQLSIMQQHRDEAARLPAEAAARLVDASYTLSRDVQSPSKVLLNWLWGRSTPKVNNV